MNIDREPHCYLCGRSYNTYFKYYTRNGDRIEGARDDVGSALRWRWTLQEQKNII